MHSAATVAPRGRRLCAVASSRRCDVYLLAGFIIREKFTAVYSSGVADAEVMGEEYALDVVHGVVDRTG